MAITFENEKILFDDKYRTAKEIDCFFTNSKLLFQY